MTPGQALQILDGAASVALLSRQEHVTAQKAIQVLTQTLTQANSDEAERLKNPKQKKLRNSR